MPKSEKPQTFKFKTASGAPYQIGDAGRHAELTPEKLAESIRNQSKWATQSPYVGVDAQMSAVFRARREAVDWLEGLRQVELELHQRHTKDERKELKGLFNHYSKLLAEALATMGEFEQALSVLPKHEVALRREWKALHEAVWRDDSKRCGARP